MRIGWMVAVQVCALCGGAFASESEPGLDTKIAKNFKVRWSSVYYNKYVSVGNPEIAQRSDHRETLTLSCQAEVLDPSLILGTGRTGIITQMTDSGERDVAVNSPSTSPRDTYDALRYDQDVQRPGPTPRWRTIIDTILQRPPRRPGPPQMVTVLRPCEITTELDMGLLAQAGGELRTVKGYFHAIVPGSIEKVDVPFEPNNIWVRLTPDVEIQVQEAVCGNNFYRYQINARPQGGSGMRPLMVGQGIPARFVAAQQFIGEDGKPMRHQTGSVWLPAHVGGGGSGGGSSIGRIKAIRYIIAVDAKECRVPFEVQRVTLPKP
jgi:hypothetical protein